MRFTLHSFRFYGEPKLTKPKELKGIKQVFSIDFTLNKCRCEVFIKGNDVWIKHRDYFSENMTVDTKDIGTPLRYRAKKYMDKEIVEKFIYVDNWGAIVLRNEAWIVLENLIKEVESDKFALDIVIDIREQQERYHNFEEYSLVSTEMERFWENLIIKLYERVEKNDRKTSYSV